MNTTEIGTLYDLLHGFANEGIPYEDNISALEEAIAELGSLRGRCRQTEIERDEWMERATVEARRNHDNGKRRQQLEQGMALERKANSRLLSEYGTVGRALRNLANLWHETMHGDQYGEDFTECGEKECLAVQIALGIETESGT